VVCFHCRV